MSQLPGSSIDATSANPTVNHSEIQIIHTPLQQACPISLINDSEPNVSLTDMNLDLQDDQEKNA